MKAHIGSQHYLTATQRNSIKRDIREQVRDEMINIGDRMFLDELATILFVLNNEFGFGQKRLSKFVCCYADMHKELRERYEMDPTYDGWICTEKLKDAGIDLDELYGKLEPRYKR